VIVRCARLPAPHTHPPVGLPTATRWAAPVPGWALRGAGPGVLCRVYERERDKFTLRPVQKRRREFLAASRVSSSLSALKDTAVLYAL
jgi:hypothetical protein